MADIYVPGDELQTANDQLGRVLALIDAGGRPADLATALGNSPDVLDAAQLFDDRWSDGRYQMSKEGTEISDKITECLDAFTSTDDDLTKDM
jgi:hypothetical protein